MVIERAGKAHASRERERERESKVIKESLVGPILKGNP
jgi:hypothetical protein